MLLAAEGFDLIHKITDQPWPGFQVHGVTLMSRAMATMILVAILLLVIILPLARRYREVPKGGRNVLEILVIFTRDWIAKPALHDRAYKFLPFLLTLFLFVLGMNLIGLMPLEAISEAITSRVAGWEGKNIGGTATSVMSVCGGLAVISLVMVLAMSLKTAAVGARNEWHLPWIVAIVISPLVWLKSLMPPIPGFAGYVLKLPMMLVELVGVFSRCGALMIRLFANMISGHTLLAVFMMLIVQAGLGWAKEQAPSVFYVTPLCIVASVGIMLLELLVAVLQAYVFAFLTAIFIGLAMEEGH